MKILLIDPVTTARTLPLKERRRLRRGIGYPGLGLLTVAALTPRDIDVTFVDQSVDEIDISTTPDLVGITVQCPTAPYAYELSSSFRKRGIPVVLGGIHTSLNPDEAAPQADAIVVGEAELTWPQLLEDFRRGRMKQRYVATTLADLDTSPVPRRELLRCKQYQIPQVVQASKGCSFGCEFCSLYAFVGCPPRFRRIEHILQEVRAIPGDKVLFADDNIYNSRTFAKNLFSALVPLKRRWVAESTWNIAFDDEVLTLAKESGCVGLFLGFDSITRQPNIKKVPGSSGAEEVYIKAIQRVHAKGIAVVAAFVFGLENDELCVFERSLNVALRGGANLVNFSTLVPYPGTPIFRRLREEHRITEWDWSKYISPHVCFEPKNMTADELEKGTRWAQREFYSLHNIANLSLHAFKTLGWGLGLLSLQLNLAQKRNWGKGSTHDESTA